MIGRRITPSLVVAGLALFVALGGSAFAVGTRTAKLGCAAGAAKAYVTFDAEHFTGSFPQSFSSDPKLFARRYTCNGRTPQARGTSDGMEIRFPGVPAGAARVSGGRSSRRAGGRADRLGDRLVRRFRGRDDRKRRRHVPHPNVGFDGERGRPRLHPG